LLATGRQGLGVVVKPIISNVTIYRSQMVIARAAQKIYGINSRLGLVNFHQLHAV
jgi:hypothetical protein